MSVLVLAAVVTLGTLGAIRRVRARHRVIERRRARRELPGTVFDLTRSVRAGATLEVAVREVAPHVGGLLGRELRGVVALLDRGYGTDRSLDQWRRATVVEGVELLVSACRFSVGRGTGLVGALDGVAATLTDRIEVSDEVAALAAQARTSTVVLVALPPAGAVLFAVIDPAFAGVLLTTTAGRVCVGVGIALDLLGAKTSRVLVERLVAGDAT